MAKMSQMERDDIIVAVITGVFGSLIASILYALVIQKQINNLSKGAIQTEQAVVSAINQQ